MKILWCEKNLNAFFSKLPFSKPGARFQGNQITYRHVAGRIFWAILLRNPSRGEILLTLLGTEEFSEDPMKNCSFFHFFTKNHAILPIFNIFG